MKTPASVANRQLFLGLAVLILIPFLVLGMAKGPWTVTDSQVVWLAVIVRYLAFVVIFIGCFDTLYADGQYPWWFFLGLLLPAPCLVMLIIHALAVKLYPSLMYSDLCFAGVALWFWIDFAGLVDRSYPPPPRPEYRLLPLPPVPPPVVVPQPPVFVLPPPKLVRVHSPAPLPPPPAPNTAELEIERHRREYEAQVAEVKGEGVGRDPAPFAEQLKYLKELFDQKVKEIRS